MRLMRDFLDRFAWWTFRPDQALLVEQPGAESIGSFIGVARTLDKRSVIAYLPQGGTVKLNAAALGRVLSSRWYDPSTSALRPARSEGAGPTLSFTTPGANPGGDPDWVLWLDLDPAR
jgi:hypothetical protein